jgi:ribosome maturation factor RimP
MPGVAHYFIQLNVGCSPPHVFFFEPCPSAVAVTSKEVGALIEQVVAAHGGEVVDLEFSGSRRKPLVRVYVEIPGGTTVEACANLSREIETRLDASAALGEVYTLEVSSPGLDRPLRTRRDFERFLMKKVRVASQVGKEGGRELVGVLEEVRGAESEPDAGESFSIAVRAEGSGEVVRWSSDEIASAKPYLPW